MSMHYSDPKRATEPYALPDVEVFHHVKGEPIAPLEHTDDDGNESELDTGWYWWTCYPGCLPDDDPKGPFTTEVEAIADAQSK